MRIKSVIVILLAVIAGALISCSKSKSDEIFTYKATLSGASETPANASTATGDATLSYNNTTKVFSIVVNYDGITASNGHIHKAAVGVPGNVVFAFTNPLSSPINYTSPALTADQEADLNAGLYYVNLHTAAFPNGEIRGQIIKQ